PFLNFSCSPNRRALEDSARLFGLWPGVATRDAGSNGPLLLAGVENGHRFHLDQQIRPAKNGLNTRGSRQRIQSLLLEELRADFVEGGVVALDVPQVASGADDVLPRCA